MKKILLISIFLLFLMGCNLMPAQKKENINVNSNVNMQVENPCQSLCEKKGYNLGRCARSGCIHGDGEFMIGPPDEDYFKADISKCGSSSSPKPGEPALPSIWVCCCK